MHDQGAVQPPTEKVHQIIARTALFVSKHGGQSEIILRVKQGNNPTFGFLMPDHELHAYFRFLVDRTDLLQSDSDLKAQNEGKEVANEHKEHDGVGGALSLLGSVYGSGEDEEPADGYDPSSKLSSEAFDGPDTTNVSCSLQRAESISKTCDKEKVSTLSLRSCKDNEKAPTLKKNNPINASKRGNIMRKQDDFDSSAASEKTKAELSGLVAVSKTRPLVEPPSDLKRSIDKIVEFVLKNGKQFESTLMEQDSRHGRFPFLLPSNHYHPYYLKILQKAQESKVDGRDKRVSLEESDTSSLRTAGYDLPYVFDKKEKFKMVISKSKKDTLDSVTRTSQQEDGVNVDAAAAAAILQAATRGIKNPNLSIFSGSSKNSDSQGHSSEGGQASSFLNGPPSGPSIIDQKSDQRKEHGRLIPKAKEIAKSAAAEAASEADSSEADLSKEQKLKAERLRRAKMFVALLKSGAAPVKRDSSHGGSVGLQESALSGSGTKINVVTEELEGTAPVSELTAVEREESSAPLHEKTSNENEKSELQHTAEEQERRARRKYRSRSGRLVEEDKEEDEGGEEEQQQQRSRKKHRSSRKDEEEISEVRDDKRSKKKRRSRCHTHQDGGNADEDKDDEDNRRSGKKRHRRHSSPEYDDDERRDAERDHKHGRKKHSSRRSSLGKRNDDSEGDYKHSKRASRHSRDRRELRKKHCDDDESDRSHRASHRSRDRHEHRKKQSSDGESEREYQCANFSKDEEQTKEREELEEGEIGTKVSDQSRGSMGGGFVSREASVDVSSSHQRAPSQLSESTVVSDDLRAKIRAMLMATRG